MVLCYNVSVKITIIQTAYFFCIYCSSSKQMEEIALKTTTFFKPTPLHKEFLLLQMIEKNSNVTQREIASAIGVSPAMVNKYLDEFENKGLIKRSYESIKVVKYYITKEGSSRKKILNIRYLESALNVYNDAKDDCYRFFESIISKGYKNILFYGAGEVAEIMLTVINNDKDIDLNVLAIIDDDVNKQGKSILTKKIISLNEINDYQNDGILISTYTNKDKVYNKLINFNYDRNKILQFFEEK